MKRETVDIRVRYADTDGFGVVYYANYLVYFEVGRTEFLRATGLSYRQMEERGVHLVVVHAECDYRAPAHYDDLLRVETRVEKLGRTSVTFGTRIVRPDDGVLIVEGKVVVVCLGGDRRVRRLPEDLAEALRIED